MTQPETLLVGAIRKEIEARYPECHVIKIHGGPMQVSGIPDLLVFNGGRTYGLEVKVQRVGESVERARLRMTPLQKATIKKLRKAGITADCVTSAAEALAVMTGKKYFLDTDDDVAEVIDIGSRRKS